MGFPVGQLQLRRAASRGQTGSFGGQAEMGQDLADGLGVVDASDEAQRSTTPLARPNVLLENLGQ
ncbi:MAG: hypothetical protein JRH20_21855 [Deltaproteobacteria bacterium]|nr:hypothetical protein [Deltaproteobacteria bacterium]